MRRTRSTRRSVSPAKASNGSSTALTRPRKPTTTTSRRTATAQRTHPRASHLPAPGRSAKRTLFVGTRKGLFLLRSDASRSSWKLDGPHFLGHIIHHVVLDPRDRGTLLAAARTGHLGPTVFRSTDLGRTWKEAQQPPAFPKSPRGLAVDHVFWLTPGHASQPNTWYAGTSPQGLFRSDDGGVTWSSVDGFNSHPRRNDWAGGDGTPDGPTMHSILVDPRDAKHLYTAMSSGGVFESSDEGRNWRPLNKGVVAEFLPDPNPEFGQDPHCVVLHPLQPDRLYQQNHCGIYRLDRPSETWERIGDNMPRDIGDIGFPFVVHPRDPETGWVFPMDGTTVWPRTSPGGRPAVYRTSDGGRTWRRLSAGLPGRHAWLTVKRQAMTADDVEPVGLYFGTTSGEVWASADGGTHWRLIAAHLPEIYTVTTGAPA
jgi:hypothetical protein